MDPQRRIIRGYELTEPLGQGAFGAVYRAHQPQVERTVAVKVILPEHANRPDFIRRFESEAQIIAQLEHPHIVPLYDYWREPDGAFLVMRYMSGGSLKDMLEKRKPELPEVIRIVEQISAALSLAHRRGVVHRDLKPANILLDEDGNAYLSDFGIAKGLQSERELTSTGAIVGSPGYLSPEQVKGEAVTPQTDLYALGFVLYELLIGGHPFAETPVGALLVKHISDPIPSLVEKRPGLPAALDDVIQKATAKDPTGRFEDASAFLDALRNALGDSETDLFVDHGLLLELDNPYKGLRAFQEADAAEFFGREALTDQLLDRLSESGPHNRFLAVVGPSGSGKSSVVKAGLLPVLRNGELPDSQNWFIVEMVPGADPFEELGRKLEQVSSSRRSGLSDELREHRTGLVKTARLCLPSDEDTLLLVIDQFEELFTLVREPAVTALFLESLHTAITDARSRIRVITTLRADFYDQPLMHPDFSRLVQARTEVVVPLTADELSRAIRSPAERAGARLEDGLVTRIVADVVEQPGALPLLQYALTELFEYRVGRMLTLASYEGIGGVLGALGKRAEGVYKGQTSNDQKLSRQIFLRLVTLGEGVEDTRRRVLQSELVGLGTQDAVLRVLDDYGRYRLLTFDLDPVTRTPTVEVAHEALLREWPRLRRWLDESRADVRMQRVLGNAAVEWLAAGKDQSFLLRGSRLDQYEAWVQGAGIVLTQDERQFLEASLEERRRREAEEEARQARERALEQRSLQRLRIIVIVLVAASIVGITLTAAVFRQSRIAQQNAVEAQEGRSVNLAILAQNELENDNTDLALALALAANGIEDPPAVSRRTLLDIAYAPGTRTLFNLPKGVLSEADFTKDGNHILISSIEGLIQLIEIKSGEIIREFRAKENLELVDLHVHPSGESFLAGYRTGEVISWDLETGRPLFQAALHDGRLGEIDISPDGLLGISGGSTENGLGEMVLFDMRTGEEILRFGSEEHNSRIESVKFHPDNRSVIAASGDETNIGDFTRDDIRDVMIRWDIRTGEILKVYEPAPNDVLQLDISPDGKQVLLTTREFNLLYMDIDTGEVIHTLEGHEATPFRVKISPGGGSAISGDGTGDVIWWDLSTGSSIRHLRGHPATIRAIDYSSDGKQVIIGDETGAARLWDLFSAWEIMRFGDTDFRHEGTVVSAAISRDGKYALTGSGRGLYWFEREKDNSLILWDYATGDPIKRLEGHSDTPLFVEFYSDRQRAISASYDGSLIIWDLKKGEMIQRLIYDGEPLFTVALSPDGNRAVTGSWSSPENLVWDLNNGEVLYRLFGHINITMAGEFTSDGRYVLLTGADWPSATVTIWEVESGRQMARYMNYVRNPHQESFSKFSPDNRHIFTYGLDSTLSIWNLQTDDIIQQFFGHEHLVWQAQFIPGSNQMISASWDASLIIWDVETGELLHRLGGPGQGHNGPVYGVAVSPDGETALSTAADGSIIKWRVGEVDLGEMLDWIAENRYIAGLNCVQRETYRITPLCDENGTLPSGSEDLLGNARIATSSEEIVPTEDAAAQIEPLTFEPWPTYEAKIGENRGAVPLGGYESWLYNGSAGEVLTITMLAEHPIENLDQVSYETRFDLGLLNPELWLVGPDGLFVVNSDNRDPENFDFNAQITELVLPMDGEYRIEARSYLEQTAGEYILIIESSKNP